MRLLWAALFMLVPLTAAGSLNGLTVIIDAGHGNFDTGTKRRWRQGYITEAQITWGVAQELRLLLGDDSARVLMTTRQLLPPPPYGSTVLFGQDTIPSAGATVFTFEGQAPIVAGRSGLAQRIALAKKTLAHDSTSRIVFLSLHFDHVIGSGRPGGARIIYPAGPYDTLLVECLAVALNEDSLLRAKHDRPTVANGRSGLGRHLLILRQATEPPPKRRKHRMSLVCNPIQRTLLIELANLPNNRDWTRLQQAGALRRYAVALRQGLRKYWQRVCSAAIDP